LFVVAIRLIGGGKPRHVQRTDHLHPHPWVVIWKLAMGNSGVIVVFNVTFNNISVISWQSVLLVEETGVPE
jgi:hypothetical protein